MDKQVAEYSMRLFLNHSTHCALCRPGVGESICKEIPSLFPPPLRGVDQVLESPGRVGLSTSSESLDRKASKTRATSAAAVVDKSSSAGIYERDLVRLMAEINFVNSEAVIQVIMRDKTLKKVQQLFCKLYDTSTSQSLINDK